MKKATVLNKVLSVLLVVSLVLSLAIPGLAAQTDVSFKQVSNSSVSAKLPGREAADVAEDEAPYADTEIVRVSIVLEKAGTLEAGYAVETVGTNFFAKMYRSNLRKEQDKITSKIENAIDADLDVVWNLTLAANIISANVAYGQIDEIESVKGVEKVLIETIYETDVVSTGVADPNMATSGAQTGTAPAWAAGYTGAGSRIAIIDTGVDVDHISFDAAAFEYSLAYRAGLAGMTPDEYKASLNLLTAAEIDKLASELNAPVTGSEAYINSKIAFGYNYIDGSLDISHMNDNQGEHGSHVSGIATANAFVPSENGFVSALDNVFVQGVAPDAQLITMKVFGKKSPRDTDYLGAIEDAIILGADSINLSLGSGNPGRSRSSTEEFQAIMERLADTGVVVSMSAGNSGHWAEMTYPGYLYADDVSMHTGGSPGSFTNSLGVASVNNDGKVGLYFAIGDLMVVYNEMLQGNSGKYSNLPFSTIAGEHEYVFIDGIGTAEEWAAVGDALVGKIALCSRGDISFFEKAKFAVEAGAIATFIYNNQDGVINMDLTDYPYTEPCASLTMADGAAVKAASTAVTTEDGYVYYTGKMTISSGVGMGQFNSSYYTMSSFSAWGVPQSLIMKPEITAPGGDILSVNGANKASGNNAHDQYELMSGTSMAAPQVTGMAAILAQYIEANGLAERTGLTNRQLAQSLLMSTADPMLANASSYYPVLQQGAGLANVGAALMADTYILMDANATASYADGKVKAELGDDPARTGKYNFSFTINNMDDVEKLYNLSADFFIQAPVSDGYDMYMNTATALIGALSSFTVDGKAVTAAWDMDGADFNGDGTVNVLDGQALLDYATGLRTELTNAANADFDADGDIDSQDAYLFLAKAESLTTVPANGSVKVDVAIEIPASWKATIDYYYPNGTYLQGYVYADGVASEEGVAGTAHSIPVLGFYGNWSDPSMYDKGSAMEYAYGLETRAPYLYQIDSNALAANALTILYAGDKTEYLFGGNPMIADATYMPERNAINATSSLNKLTFTAIRNAAASRFFVADAATGALLLEKELGAVDGAFYYVNGEAWQSYGYYWNAGLGFEGVPDNTKLEVGLTLAPEYYVDADGNTDWDALGTGATFSMPLVVDNTAPTLEDVSLSLTGNTLTVTASDNQYVSAVVLYNKKGTEVLTYEGAKQDIDAGESASYVLDLSTVKGNKFLLQVTDYALNATTYEINLGGEDEPVVLPGRIAFNLSKGFWTSFDGEKPTASIIRTEYEASDYTYYAGTIVDDYVFAATDAGDLHVMPLSDLTDVTVACNLGGTVSDMAYNKADGKVYAVSGTALVTIDKLTGEVALAGELPFNTNTLACDANGTFYCNKYGSGEVYSFTLDTMDAPVKLCAPFTNATQYVQAMEIDPNTGKLCWTAFYKHKTLTTKYSYYFEIDVNDGTYTKSNSLTDELAVLLIPDKTSGGNWANPTDTVTGVQVAPATLDLMRGTTATLTAAVQPWTATDRTVTWTSSNEAVATVDQNGVVTAISAGEAVITATSNLTKTVSGSCTVTVSAPTAVLEGVLQDEEGTSMFFKWDMANEETWTGGVQFDSSITSATKDPLNNKYYVMSSAGESMNLVNPETGAIEVVGGNGAGVPLWDMEYSSVFSTAEAPKVNSIYYYYFLPGKDPMALDTAAFGLSSYLSTYSGASYVVAITSLGYVPYEKSGVTYDTEWIMMLDNAGYLWEFYIYEVDGGYSAFLGYYETDLVTKYGPTFPGNKDDMYCSMVAADMDNLFVSVYTGTTNDIYKLSFNYETFETYDASYVGSFGEDIWPVALTAASTGVTSGTDAVRKNAAFEISSTNVSAEELAAAKAEVEALNTMTMVADVTEDVKVELKAENKAPVVALPMSAPAVSAKEDLVTINVTAGAAATNGVSTITFDSAALELLTVNVLGDYTSINAADGSVTIGFVDLDGVAADAVIATLTFKPKNTEDTTVTIVTNELNNDKPGTEEVVEVKYPHTNTEIRDAKDATCTEEGYTGDTYCADCGKLIAKGEVIPAKGHGETEIKDAKEPTCTEEGYTGDTYCTVCGEKVADGEAIPAKGHGETEIKDAKDATCTEEGYTGDTYCTVCGEKVADGEAIPATGHQHTEIKDAKPATTTEEGYTGDTYCTDCGEKIAEGESIPMIDPENPKTSEGTRAFLMATAAVMVAAAAAVVVMLSRKKLF